MGKNRNYLKPSSLKYRFRQRFFWVDLVWPPKTLKDKFKFTFRFIGKVISMIAYVLLKLWPTALILGLIFQFNQFRPTMAEQQQFKNELMQMTDQQIHHFSSVMTGSLLGILITLIVIYAYVVIDVDDQFDWDYSISRKLFGNKAIDVRFSLLLTNLAASALGTLYLTLFRLNTFGSVTFFGIVFVLLGLPDSFKDMFRLFRKKSYRKFVFKGLEIATVTYGFYFIWKTVLEESIKAFIK